MKFNIMRLFYIFIMQISPLFLVAQAPLTTDQIKQDYSIFKNILTNAHPGLFEYTTPEQWDSIFSIHQNQLGELKTRSQLFRTISGLASQVHDGHLTILHPQLDTIPLLFPLQLKIVNGELYVDFEEEGIPLGSIVDSINGKSGEELISKMLKYASSDGYNLTKKYREIEKDFGIYYFYEYGEVSMFEIKYSTPEGISKSKKVAAQEFEKIGQKYPFRSSHFSNYHDAENELNFFKKHFADPWPFVYYIDSLKTAVLTCNSFGVDPTEFKSKLVEIFKEIRKKKVKNLIIDVRQNMGGYRANAIHLLSFVLNEPFQQREAEFVIADSLPQSKYIVHTMSDYTSFLADYFKESQKQDGKRYLKKDHAVELLTPYKKPFKGKTYVLTGGKTFSAATAFALSAKNTDYITLVGEETGGGYYTHTGQFPVLYELPNSKIRVRISIVQIVKYVVDKSIPKGSGVLPDFHVELNQQDLIEGTDSQLQFILDQINGLILSKHHTK